MEIILRSINGVLVLSILQVGANGHPCPLHLNPPSMADFPFVSSIYVSKNNLLSTITISAKYFYKPHRNVSQRVSWLCNSLRLINIRVRLIRGYPIINKEVKSE